MINSKRIKIVSITIISVMAVFIVSYAFFTAKESTNISRQTQTYSISEEQLMKLYKQGYGVQDIETAAAMVSEYGMTIEDILKLKGLHNYSLIKDKKGNSSVVDSGRSWDEVRCELNLRKSLKILGASSSEINKTVAAFKDKIMKYKENPKSNADNSISKKKPDMKNAITLDDITKCKEKGITKLEDISKAKKLALKYNSSIDNVIKIKNQKKSWNEVEKVLGGGKK